MDQSLTELGFTSRKQRCTHGSLSSTHCGHGHRYPSYRPLTGCDHEGTNSSRRGSAVDEVSGKQRLFLVCNCVEMEPFGIIINVDVITLKHQRTVINYSLKCYCQNVACKTNHFTTIFKFKHRSVCVLFLFVCV